MNRYVLAVVLSTSVACNDNGPRYPTGDSFRAGDTYAGPANYSDALGPEPDFSAPHGRIVMKSWFQWGHTELSGAFADGPDLRMHVESDRIGNCRLVTFAATTCTPSCAAPNVCIDSVCRSWPTRMDRGTLQWVWPDGEQTVEPDVLLFYYATGIVNESGTASVSVDGMRLEAPVVEAPIAENDWTAELQDRQAGADATLRWTNPITRARVRLHMTDCTGSHGGIATAEIECEAPDVGELVLPGLFVDTLDGGDWSRGECGLHELERYHVSTPVGDDTVRFETVSSDDFFYFPGR